MVGGSEALRGRFARLSAQRSRRDAAAGQRKERNGSTQSTVAPLGRRCGLPTQNEPAAAFPGQDTRPHGGRSPGDPAIAAAQPILSAPTQPSLQLMGVETRHVVTVGRFPEGQGRFLGFHRKHGAAEGCAATKWNGSRRRRARLGGAVGGAPRAHRRGTLLARLEACVLYLIP